MCLIKRYNIYNGSSKKSVMLLFVSTVSTLFKSFGYEHLNILFVIILSNNKLYGGIKMKEKNIKIDISHWEFLRKRAFVEYKTIKKVLFEILEEYFAKKTDT